MIDKYLGRGEMFLLFDKGEVRTSCVLTQEGPGIWELKSLATRPHSQGRGYGRAMVSFARGYCRGRGGRRFTVGTGDSPGILGFYESCGFAQTHRVKNFFTDNYPEPIWDEGKQGYLTDMVYLGMEL